MSNSGDHSPSSMSNEASSTTLRGPDSGSGPRSQNDILDYALAAEMLDTDSQDDDYEPEGNEELQLYSSLQMVTYILLDFEEDTTTTSESTNVNTTSNRDEPNQDEGSNPEAQNDGRRSPIYSTEQQPHMSPTSLLIKISYSPANLAPSRASRFSKYVC